MRPTAAGAAILALALVGCELGDPEDDGDLPTVTTGGRLVIGANPSGPRIEPYGYDVKQPSRAAELLLPGAAEEIFGTIGMGVIRIPIYAAAAHPAAGQVTAAAYDDVVAAVAAARAARPGVTVFASLKLASLETFPAWVDGQDGKVDASRYARLVRDFLDHMQTRGVRIDVLGIDNENGYNEANLVPRQHAEIVSSIRAHCHDRGLAVPRMIGPEDFSPQASAPWLRQLFAAGLGGAIDLAGVHTYSAHRARFGLDYADAIGTFAAAARDKEKWDSEFHWSALVKQRGLTFDDAKFGLMSAFDHFDHGFTTLTWWGFRPRSLGDKTAVLETELVESTTGARPLPTDDDDGRPMARGRFNTRAFAQGHDVVLWVVNASAQDRGHKWVQLTGAHLTTAPSFRRWTPTGPAAGLSGQARLVGRDDSIFSMTFPADSITRVRIPGVR